jgi:cytoskeleton protein RodZ
MTLGERLRKARQEQKRTVADVTRETKISGWVVEALEANELHARMSPIYVRGFVTTYAKFLKLDPAPLLAELAPAQPVQEPAAAPTLPPPAPARAPMRVKLPSMKLPAVKLPAVKIPKVRIPKVELELPLLRRAAIAAAAVALTVVAGRTKAWERLPQLPQRQAKAEAPQPRQVAKAPEAKTAPAPKAEAKKPEPARTKAAAAAPAAPAPTAPRLASVAPLVEAPRPPALPALTLAVAEPLELHLATRRTTWVRVKADGKLMTQRRLQRGAKEHWSAKKVFELIIANPSDVEVTLNGQAISSLALAHKGRLLITHRGVSPLTEE